MLSSVVAFFSMLSESFKSLKECKSRQSETDVIKTKKNKEKAVEVAEKIIFYIENAYNVKEDKKYQRLKKRFFKYN